LKVYVVVAISNFSANSFDRVAVANARSRVTTRLNGSRIRSPSGKTFCCGCARKHVERHFDERSKRVFGYVTSVRDLVDISSLGSELHIRHSRRSFLWILHSRSAHLSTSDSDTAASRIEKNHFHYYIDVNGIIVLKKTIAKINIYVIYIYEGKRLRRLKRVDENIFLGDKLKRCGYYAARTLCCYRKIFVRIYPKSFLLLFSTIFFSKPSIIISIIYYLLRYRVFINRTIIIIIIIITNIYARN